MIDYLVPCELLLVWMNLHVFGCHFLVLDVAVSWLVLVSVRGLDLCSPIPNTNFLLDGLIRSCFTLVLHLLNSC